MKLGQELYSVTIVVPTFNERENVRPLFQAISDTLQGASWEAVYVDDDSPDGTADEVRLLATEHPNARVIQRIGRRGLAGACIEGILSSAAPLVAVIDADLQHDETRLRTMLDAMQADSSLDLVIGSRNVVGGTAEQGLSPFRKWGSDRATDFAKRMLKIDVSDPMSGFFMVRRSSFNIVVPGLKTSGFKILTDMLASAEGKWHIREIPYDFRPRTAGESKMDPLVMFEFLTLLLTRSTGRIISGRFAIFGLVGLLGVFVQLAIVRIALIWLPNDFAIAQSIGVFVAMTTNFLLNNTLTYRDLSLRGRAMWRGLLSFYVVCGFGALLNVALAAFVYLTISSWILASISGTLGGAMWNFVASSRYTWRAT